MPFYFPSKIAQPLVSLRHTVKQQRQTTNQSRPSPHPVRQRAQTLTAPRTFITCVQLPRRSISLGCHILIFYFRTDAPIFLALRPSLLLSLSWSLLLCHTRSPTLRLSLLHWGQQQAINRWCMDLATQFIILTHHIFNLFPRVIWQMQSPIVQFNLLKKKKRDLTVLIKWFFSQWSFFFNNP